MLARELERVLLEVVQLLFAAAVFYVHLIFGTQGNVRWHISVCSIRGPRRLKQPLYQNGSAPVGSGRWRGPQQAVEAFPVYESRNIRLAPCGEGGREVIVGD